MLWNVRDFGKAALGTGLCAVFCGSDGPPLPQQAAKKKTPAGKMCDQTLCGLSEVH
jgi:hypothetical protein